MKPKILQGDEARDALIADLTRMKTEAEKGNISGGIFRLVKADGTVEFREVGFEGERPDVVQSIKDSLNDIANGVTRRKNTLS